MFKDTVEVISIAPAFDGSTGKPTFQVQFGHLVNMSDEVRRSIPRPPGTAPPQKQPLIVMGVFADFEGEVPYKVGSKWSLEIKDDGTMTLKEQKK
jgi:hypothetical protein